MVEHNTKGNTDDSKLVSFAVQAGEIVALFWFKGNFGNATVFVEKTGKVRRTLVGDPVKHHVHAIREGNGQSAFSVRRKLCTTRSIG